MSDRPERVIITERRETRREGTNAPASLTLPDGIVVEGVFIDLGPWGGRFRTAYAFGALLDSALVRLEFRDLAMTARVVWHKRYYDGTQDVSVLGLEAIDDPRA